MGKNFRSSSINPCSLADYEMIVWLHPFWYSAGGGIMKPLPMYTGQNVQLSKNYLHDTITHQQTLAGLIPEIRAAVKSYKTRSPLVTSRKIVISSGIAGMMTNIPDCGEDN